MALVQNLQLNSSIFGAALDMTSAKLHGNQHQENATFQHHRRKGATVCRIASPEVSSADSSAPAGQYTPSGVSSLNIMTAAVNALFSFQPFFRFAAGKAREMMVKRGDLIGYPWEPTLKVLREHDWETEIKAVERKGVEYPDYYLKPFHAYEKGNLSLDAALEMELAAKAVHAPIFDPKRSELDPDGDLRLRRSYHEKLKTMLRIDPSLIVDIGCATGLSTLELFEAFPRAKLIGVDLSPYFLAMANYNIRKLTAEQGREFPISYVHAAGEDTGLPDCSADLVSICLVCHELPRSATTKIIAEANRVLKPGGALAIMEMNPNSPFFQSMVDNVFAFTAFKATEPYLDDYRTFPIEEAIAEAGFEYPSQEESSPRHRTIVAHKTISL